MSLKSLLFLLALCALPVAVLAQDSVVWSGGISLDEREQAPDLPPKNWSIQN